MTPHKKLTTMLKINLVSLCSQISNDALTFKLERTINKLKNNGVLPCLDGNNAFFTLFLVVSGGAEKPFVDCYQKYPQPYVFFFDQNDNSLAASLEIIAFLKSKQLRYEILPSDFETALIRIKEYSFAYQAKSNLKNKRLGVVGKPSDWLIASEVSPCLVHDKFGIDLISINYDELVAEIDMATYDITLYQRFAKQVADLNELEKALKIYSALLKLVKRYNLNGLTIRCFDLLFSYRATACLALALLNDAGIVATCEGDVPALLSMYFVKVLLDLSTFQANPSYLQGDTLVLAHCTIPLSMCLSYNFKTHFESNLSLAIKGNLKMEEITILRLNNHLDDYLLTKGQIIANLDKECYCRTQIEIKSPEIEKIIYRKAVGNHLICCYGDHVNVIKTFFDIIL